MIRIMMMVVLVLGLTVASHVPAVAGGMATVHLDDVPSGVVAGEPVSIGFTVMQHDVTAVNVDSAYLEATHRSLGERVSATAVQQGATGHYVVDVTFPTAGRWKWSITPAPFAGTSFESLEVAATGLETATWRAEIRDGTCAAPGELVSEVNDLLGLSPDEDGTASPVEVVKVSLEMESGSITATPHTLQIRSGDDVLACADLTGTIWESQLVVGIHDVAGSGMGGIATFEEVGAGTELTIYLSVATDTGAAAAGPAGDVITVEIVGSAEGSWNYSPANVDVSVGGTVTWVNKTDTSHTVTGSSLMYEDSSPILPGESWSQTFYDVGTFDYFCAPHPFMTGTVKVV